jgi:hypothetical protein
MSQPAPRTARPERLTRDDLGRASVAALTRALAVRRLAQQRASPLATRIVAGVFVRWTADGEALVAIPQAEE